MLLDASLHLNSCCYMGFLCYVSLPLGCNLPGLVCDCDISWSYSLVCSEDDKKACTITQHAMSDRHVQRAYWYTKPSESGSNLNSDTSDCSSLTELEVYDNNICWFTLIHEEFNACIQCAAVCLVDVYKELRAYKLHNSLPAWWLQIIKISHNITMKMYLNTLFVLFLLQITSQVKSYGHGRTVSSPHHTFSWASLNKQLTSTLCTYFRL